MNPETRQALFVCTGNICRSPMAEYLFRHRLNDQAPWAAQSAGVFAMDGGRASDHAVQALKEWSIDLSPHRSQPLTEKLVEDSDLVVVMTPEHLHQVAAVFPGCEEKTRLLTSFSPGREARAVADPIGGSIHVYRTVRDQINSAVVDMVLHLVEQERG